MKAFLGKAVTVLAVGVMCAWGVVAHAEKEHGGKEHGGEHVAEDSHKEHGGKEHGGEHMEGSHEHMEGSHEHMEGSHKEHGGEHMEGSHEHMEGSHKEHGGKEHGGDEAMYREPSSEELRQAIRDHVAQTELGKGAFTISDESTGEIRTLELVRVHERVGKTGEYYYSCADMKDVSSGEMLDLDFDVVANAAGREIADIRIHKVESKVRYTYDDNDNRIPLI